MAVVTINGEIGSGGPEVGAEVATRLNAGYVDRSILAEAAKQIGTTVEVLVDREERRTTLGEQISRFLQRILERSAAGVAGDPYLGPGVETLLGREYLDATQEPITRAQELDDTRFIEVTKAVIRDLAKGNNVVIIGRGANLILHDVPGVFHAGLVAPKEGRMRRIMERNNLPIEEAERFIEEREKARVDFFKKFFKVHPNNPAYYHLVLNTEWLGTGNVASIIVEAVLSR